MEYTNTNHSLSFYSIDKFILYHSIKFITSYVAKAEVTMWVDPTLAVLCTASLVSFSGLGTSYCKPDNEIKLQDRQMSSSSNTDCRGIQTAHQKSRLAMCTSLAKTVWGWVLAQKWALAWYNTVRFTKSISVLCTRSVAAMIGSFMSGTWRQALTCTPSLDTDCISVGNKLCLGLGHIQCFSHSLDWTQLHLCPYLKLVESLPYCYFQ